MPGTLVSDSLAAELLNTTVASAGTVNGTAVEVPYPAEVAVELATGTVTGTTVTFDVEIQGADDSGFTTNVVSYGRFATLTEASDNVTRYLEARVYKRYMRARHITAGTTPSVPVVIKVREPHYQRVNATRSA